MLLLDDEESVCRSLLWAADALNQRYSGRFGGVDYGAKIRLRGGIELPDDLSENAELPPTALALP